MSRELRQMLNRASRWADRQFSRAGMIKPVWHAVTARGEHIVMPAQLDDKDAQARLVRTAFALHNVVRYVFVVEAWVVAANGTERDKRELMEIAVTRGLASHPRRQEIVNLTCEEEGCCVSCTRHIHRPDRGKPYLGPLVEETPVEASGRFVGMLPKSTHTHH